MKNATRNSHEVVCHVTAFADATKAAFEEARRDDIIDDNGLKRCCQELTKLHRVFVDAANEHYHIKKN